MKPGGVCIEGTPNVASCVSWLFTGSLSCFWIFRTISHSRPRPLSSVISSCLAGTATGLCVSNLCQASLITSPTILQVSKSWFEVCVTSLWKPRNGMGRARNFAGICFSWRFNNLRKPATLISKYCACKFTISTRLLYFRVRLCKFRASPHGSDLMCSSSICLQRSGQLSVMANVFCNCRRTDSSMMIPVSMASFCNATISSEIWASPTRTWCMSLARSSSTRLKSCLSRAETRSSSSGNSMGGS
mmetsp:Transcript_23627/g.65716  ORF Transcript_23627/g.65716 Transcript_23627/m.65716 type:complete len:245 (+) Transcript_23627:131-865(+)